MDARDILRRAKALRREEEGRQPVQFKVTIDGHPFGTDFFPEIPETPVEEPDPVPESMPRMPQGGRSDVEQEKKTAETPAKEVRRHFHPPPSLSERLTEMGY